MQSFWRLVNILISLTGFSVTGGVLLLRGEPMLSAVVRAIISFVALFVILNLLGMILVAVAGPESPVHIKPPSDTSESQLSKN